MRVCVCGCVRAYACYVLVRVCVCVINQLHISVEIVYRHLLLIIAGKYRLKWTLRGVNVDNIKMWDKVSIDDIESWIKVDRIKFRVKVTTIKITDIVDNIQIG